LRKSLFLVFIFSLRTLAIVVSYRFRMTWDLALIMPFLIYLAVVMPFRLCFANEAVVDSGIYWFEFIIDLVRRCFLQFSSSQTWQCCDRFLLHEHCEFSLVALKSLSSLAFVRFLIP